MATEQPKECGEKETRDAAKERMWWRLQTGRGEGPDEVQEQHEKQEAPNAGKGPNS